MLKEFSTKIEINALPEIIWNVLKEFEDYPDWNPYIRSIAGELIPGSFLKMMLQPIDNQTIISQAVLVKVIPYEEIVLRENFSIGKMLYGQHKLKIVIEEGKVYFYNIEKFDGMLTKMYGKFLDKVEISLIDMNIALKREAEKQSIMGN